MADEIKEVKKESSKGSKGNREKSMQKRKAYGQKMTAKRAVKKPAQKTGVLIKGKQAKRGKLITKTEIKNKAGKVVAIKSRSV